MKLLTIIILVSHLVLFTPNVLFAQLNTSYSIQTIDSLEADQSTNFLYSRVQLKNISSSTLQLNVTFIEPIGWKIISNKNQQILIGINKEFIFPFTIAKKLLSVAKWQPLKLIITDNIFTDTAFIYVKTAELSSFTVTDIKAAFTQKQRTFETSFNLKNTGNVSGTYIIKMLDEATELNINSKIVLRAGSDTFCKFNYTVAKSLWQKYNESKLRIEITDLNFKHKIKKELYTSLPSNNTETSNPYITNINLTREDSVFAKYSSAYNLIKTDLAFGYLKNRNQATYFYSFRAELKLSTNSNIAVNYRSKQFGVYNIIDRNIIDLLYNYKKLSVRAGKVTDSKFFNTYGNGINISYRWKNYNRISLYGVIHTPGFFIPADNFGMNLMYKLKYFYVNHDLVFNNNLSIKEQSLLLFNEIRFIKIPATSISLSHGYSQTASKLTEKFNSVGQSFGYQINYNGKKISFSNQLKNFDKNYPGLNKNHKSLNASLKYKFKKIALESFYNYDYRLNNFFNDSLYNTSLLSFNIKQYGLRANYFPRKSNTTLGFGIISQQGILNQFLTLQYKYIELNYFYKSKTDLIFSLNSTTAFAKVENKPEYFSINGFNISLKQLGLNGGFSNVPRVTKSQPEEKSIVTNQQTIYGGPYINCIVFKKILTGIQYNFSKTLYDENVTQFINLNIQYSDIKTGLNVSLNGFAPLKKSTTNTLNPTQNGIINLSVKKRLFVPFAFKRKYHTIKARLYKDDNGNNNFDKNEQPIAAAKLEINDLHFISNKNGTISYKNTEKGLYIIHLDKTDVYKYLSSTTKSPNILLKRNTIIDIPFKKSNTISGSVTIIHDTNNSITYQPINIQINVKDSSGNIFSTTTNKEGHYNFNLPAGLYMVQLGNETVNDLWKLSKGSFNVNLYNETNAICNFIITQRRREMKILKIEEEIFVPKNVDKTKDKQHLNEIELSSKNKKIKSQNQILTVGVSNKIY